ncbi:MAG: mechanosensitive ion channel family protein [Candidatus Methanomethylicota archaeon]|uniref:Mechanosensitive ion channel family protein n=1 Tax=Thermoproteota archaeon TaxID=2056631 RepID=A0A497EWY1_9CREN|nr:MAG: mechanosensitive ion channel family protein [Candidatus Verstraetearchaeota archaeon]
MLLLNNFILSILDDKLVSRLGAGFKRAVLKLIFLVVAYVLSAAFIKYLFTESVIVQYFANIFEYKIYVDVLLALGFGYLIVHAFSDAIYWAMRLKYEHPTAAAIRSIFRIVGVGAMVAVIAGSLSSPTAGVALGGFIGMVVGFASQKVLGQVMAGILLLIARPFKIGDKIEAAGVIGVVEDVTSLFVVVRQDDGKVALIPCNSLIGSKIIKHPPPVETTAT